MAGIPILIVGLVLLLQGCSSGKARVEDQLAAVEQNLNGIRDALNANGIRNATIIRQYSEVLKNKRPELRSLLVELEKDATVKGPLFLGLEDRLQKVRDGAGFDSWTEKLDEASRLNSATGRETYNDAL